jgi:hypothetical protein
MRLSTLAVIACAIASSRVAGSDDHVVVSDEEEAAPRPRPWTVEATAGIDLAPLADSDLLAHVAIAGARRWDRWHVGARVSLSMGPSLFVDAETLEAGAWLHASRKIDVLLAWRTGRGGFHFGFAFVNVLEIEPVAELAFRVSRALDIRIEPIAFHFYRSDVWQATFGAEVGVAWRL